MTDDRRSGPTADRLIDRRAVDDPCSADEQVRSPDRRRVLRTASTLVAGATLAQSLGRAASAQDARPAPAAPAEPLEIAGFERVRVKTSDGTTIQASTSLGKLASSNDKRRPASCCCTARRSRTTPGATSRPSSRSVSPWSRRTCAATATAASRRRLPTTSNYSKRAMAHDQVDVMKHFGFDSSPSSATTAAAASRTGWRSTTRTTVTKLARARHHPDVLPLHARDDRSSCRPTSTGSITCKPGAGPGERAARAEPPGGVCSAATRVTGAGT